MTVDFNLGAHSINRIDHPTADLWIDKESNGHYQDMGSVEEAELLEELKSNPWREVVARRYSEARPWLHKIITDPTRAEFLRKLPIRIGGTFLDVGSGWGQVSIPLSKLGTVYCLDLTLSRLVILKEIARQERSTLNFVLGNFLSIPFSVSQFDLVIFNGSLEYMAVGTNQPTIKEVQQEALVKAHALLKANGKLYLGIENSIGLKYLLGAPDDHTGIEDCTYLSEEAARIKFRELRSGDELKVKTWSLTEYREMLELAQFKIEEVYCCFPDYKLIQKMIPVSMVNDALLKNEIIVSEHSGVDGSLLPQNEKIGAIYQQFAKNRILEHVVPSYGIVARV